MKKVVLLVLALVIASFATNNAMAQSKIGEAHRVAFGIHYGYGADPIGNLAGLNADYNMISSNLRFRANVDVLQNKKPMDGDNMCFGISANAQYLFPIAVGETNGFYLYPMAGLGMNLNKASNWKGDYGVGFNIGAGAEYQINGRLGIYVEGGYEVRFNSDDKFAFRVGVSYGI